MEQERPKTSTARLQRGTTRLPHRPLSPTTQSGINVSITQLLAPVSTVAPWKEVMVTTLSKPDVHLRKDLIKPAELYRINSSKRTNKNVKSDLEMDDELNVSPDSFHYEEMIRVGRPERDTTLRKPLMRTLQKLRKYKMGTSPSLKAGLLRETLEPVVDDKTKRVLDELSARGRPSSCLVDPSQQQGHLDLNFMPVSMSSPNLRTTTADLDNNVVKPISVKPGSANMYLYHLSSQGKRNVMSKPNESGKSENNTSELVTDSIASSVLNDEDDDRSEPVPVMYDPSTVRLPRMEIVPGFGSLTPEVESRLGAYRVHSSKAVTAAAALEEASVQEGLRSPSPSLASRAGPLDGGDSFHTERLESFYQSASFLESTQQQEKQEKQQTDDNSVHSNGASSQQSSIRSLNVSATGKPTTEKHAAAIFFHPKKSVHCGKCYKEAELWCAQCASAFCKVCWGQVLHHDLTQMAVSPTRPHTEELGGGATSTSPSKHTYAKSVLFQSFVKNTASSAGVPLENSRYNSTSAAKIPLPDYVVTQYDQYPAPPVYIDGKGHVLEDIIKRRPVTAPVFTQEELHHLQMSNRFKKQSQQEQYHQMLALKAKASTTGATGAAPSSPGFLESGFPSLGVTSGIHYEPVEQPPMAHSKGRVVVRKNKKKLRPSSPKLAATANGTLSLGYSPKPRTGTRPISGILRDGTPLDWKTALFAGNDIQESGRRSSAAASAQRGANRRATGVKGRGSKVNTPA